MEAIKNQKKANKPQKQSTEVLYQKMGDRWFAFSVVDDDVFYGAITQDEIDSKVEVLRKARKDARHKDS